MERMATDQRGPGSAGGDFPSDGAPPGSVAANGSDWRVSEVREGIKLRGRHRQFIPGIRKRDRAIRGTMHCSVVRAAGYTALKPRPDGRLLAGTFVADGERLLRAGSDRDRQGGLPPAFLRRAREHGRQDAPQDGLLGQERLWRARGIE